MTRSRSGRARRELPRWCSPQRPLRLTSAETPQDPRSVDAAGARDGSRVCPTLHPLRERGTPALSGAEGPAAIPQREGPMAAAEHKSFRASDETRNFPKGRVDLINIGGGVVGQLTLEPGWRWSEHVKPVAGTA